MPNALGSPFFSNGFFTKNGIEWCEENKNLYEILGEKFFEHHKHSLESRVCVSLYGDYFWTYSGQDRIEKLIERSKHYSQLEIMESYEESETGIIDTTPAENKDQTLIRGTTPDGKIIVQIISSTPKINQSIEINLSFINVTSGLVSNVNYGIEVTQNNQVILQNKNIYSEKGLSTLITRPLTSDDPIEIFISINGIGLPNNQEEWSGPKGEMLTFTVVPEFGVMTIILFAITVSLMIIFTQNKIKNFNTF
ncbi:MAG: hypothetical protein R3237_06090 [Nitrosopumilaceae archaeon]|nr:hypothetical protein [Nitrosopumilaceae archaeon]